jgi:hypothetical protein
MQSYACNLSIGIQKQSIHFFRKNTKGTSSKCVVVFSSPCGCLAPLNIPLFKQLLRLVGDVQLLKDSMTLIMNMSSLSFQSASNKFYVAVPCFLFLTVFTLRNDSILIVQFVP